MLNWKWVMARISNRSAIKISGVYTITCDQTNSVYVGQSKDIVSRKQCHFNSLANGKHISPSMQEDYNTYGKDAFVFNVVESCDPSLLLARELYHASVYYQKGWSLYSTHTTGIIIRAPFYLYNEIREHIKSKYPDLVKGDDIEMVEDL